MINEKREKKMNESKTQRAKSVLDVL